MIILWETRNKKIHGEDDKENEQLRKEKVTEKAKELHSLQDSVRPSDAFLFPRDLTRFINKSTAEQIGTWITTSRRAIRNSVTKWKEHKASGIQTVVE